MSSLITNATIRHREDTAGNWTSNNPTPASGEWCYETDTGSLKIGDGSTAWTALGYNISLPETYNIASANTVIALPDITGSVQRKTYYWTGGDGSHTFSFTVSDASTFGGIAATLWIGAGEGHISIESDGSNWQVREYEDTLSDATNGTARKVLNGDVYLDNTISGIAVTIASGNIFRSGSQVWTLPMTVTSVKSYSVIGETNQSWGGGAVRATTTITFRLLAQASRASETAILSATGRWRT